MRGKTTIPSTASSVEVVPSNYFTPLDFAGLFRRAAPLEVDLGCGDGAFLATLARQKCDRNFLGIDRMAGRVQSACRRIERLRLSHAPVLDVEAGYTGEYISP